MIRFLSEDELMALHRAILAASGGTDGVRDAGRIEAAVRAPMASYGGEDLYPSLVEKAAALGYSLIQGHGFVDGNKRIGHAAMEVFLGLNGAEIVAVVENAEAVILAVAASEMSREAFTEWLAAHVRPLQLM